MRDRFFREDENELPYLVYSKRDDDNHRPYHSNYEEPKSDGEKLDEILDSMNITMLERMRLEAKLISFLNARDCTGLMVEDGFDEYSFIFTRENEYVKTTDEFIYLPQLADSTRIFFESYAEHYHDGLLRNLRFQDLIERTGMEFLECTGGYVTKYSMADDEFTLIDEVEVNVSFRAGSKRRLYRLDLDSMELSEKYFEYGL